MWAPHHRPLVHWALTELLCGEWPAPQVWLWVPPPTPKAIHTIWDPSNSHPKSSSGTSPCPSQAPPY